MNDLPAIVHALSPTFARAWHVNIHCIDTIKTFRKCYDHSRYCMSVLFFFFFLNQRFLVHSCLFCDLKCNLFVFLKSIKNIFTPM